MTPVKPPGIALPLPRLALPRKRICSVHHGSRGAVCHASFGFDAVRRFRRLVVQKAAALLPIYE